MRTKRILTGILILALLLVLCVPVLAQESPDEIISLDKAVTMARENSRALQSMKISEETLRLRYKMLQETYMSNTAKTSIRHYEELLDKANDELAAGPTPARRAQLLADIALYKQAIASNEMKLMPLNLELKTNYYNAKYAYEDIAKQTADAERILDNSVQMLYLGLLGLNEEIAVQERTLELLGQQLRIERLKVSLGLSASLDEKNMVNQYNALNVALEGMRNQKTQMTWQLNDLLGREMKANLQIEQPDIKPVLMMPDYEKIVEAAAANNLSLQQHKRNIESYKDYSNDITDKKQRGIYQNMVDTTTLEITGLEETIKQKVKALINGLQNNYQSWDASRLSREKAELDYNNSRLMYDLGMISDLQLAGSKITYMEALKNEQKYANSWYNTKAKLDLAEKGIFLEG